MPWVSCSAVVLAGDPDAAIDVFVTSAPLSPSHFHTSELLQTGREYRSSERNRGGQR